MSGYVVWIDSENAKIFKMAVDGVTSSTLKKREPDHHTHSQKENHSSDHFFHQVAESLKDADEILVVGPGLAKTHFKSHLDNHHHAELSKKVLGVETMDHPTDAQILATARKFFKSAHLFH